MKRIQSKLRLLALAAGSLAISIAGANAANPYYAAGDLVLYFQQEGSSNTVYADLGNASTVFRGAATGPDAANALNIINISSQLNSAFGAGWATATNLYMGVAGVVGTSSTSTALTNLDPQRTLYVSASRTGEGTIGTANSTGYTVNTTTAMTTGAGNIDAMMLPFADSTGANGYITAAVYSTSSTTSAITAQNPFLAAGIPGTAFSIFGGGVQQVGGTIASGTSFGSVSNVAFAVDLYRIEARNNISLPVAQVGLGETLRAGTYEGTITLNDSGSVSFQTSAVPEPSTYAFLGISALGIGFIVARRRKVNA